MTGREMDAIWPGRPLPLGATCEPTGTNFALWSREAERVELCLLDDAPGNGTHTERRIELTERSGDNWHGFVPGVGPGQRYGYRVHGPWSPERGYRFNPDKLLVDPYARALDGQVVTVREPFSLHLDGQARMVRTNGSELCEDPDGVLPCVWAHEAVRATIHMPSALTEYDDHEDED